MLIRGNASGTMGMPNRGWFEEGQLCLIEVFFCKSKSFLLLAERNFRAAEKLDYEITRLTEDVNHLRLQLDANVREMERTLQVRFVVLSVEIYWTL